MNDDFYLHYIDTVKDKINKMNETLFDTTIEKKSYSNSTVTSSHKDDTMALQNLIWQQQVAQYRDTQKKINRNINYTKQEFNVIDDEEALMETIKKESYKKTWNRLDTFQKKEKVREFIEEKKNKIQEYEYKLILDSLQDIIKKGNSKKIVYNNKDSIQSIWCIIHNKDEDTYSFQL